MKVLSNTTPSDLSIWEILGRVRILGSCRNQGRFLNIFNEGEDATCVKSKKAEQEMRFL